MAIAEAEAEAGAGIEAPAGGGSHREALRAMTRTMYDLQKNRIMLGNRVSGHFRAQLGQKPGMSTDELSEEAQRILRTLRLEYPLFADAVVRSDMRRWNKELNKSTGLIRSPYDLALARLYIEMEKNEERAQHDIQLLVREFPIWGWLESVRGVGPVMAAVLISELDPHKAPRPSCFWSYCFPAGTLITTPNGMVPIEQIGASDTVIDIDGQPTPVVRPIERTYSGDLVTLDVTGSLPLSLTEEHPIRIMHHGIEMWCDAREVEPGDKVFVPALKLEREPVLHFGATAKAIGKAPILGKPMTVTADLAYLLGRYVGDGCASTWLENAVYQRGRIQVVFGNEEVAEAQQYFAQVQATFGGARLLNGPETIRVDFGRGTVAARFKEWFGYQAHGKRLPDVIMGLSDDEAIRSFLRGYFDADGSIVKEGRSAGTITASSASAGLTFQIQSLLGKLGVFGSIHRTVRAPDERAMIRGHAITQRAERYVINVPTSASAAIYPDVDASFTEPKRKIIAAENGWYLTVKRVLRMAVVNLPVYNLETASHTYLAQNIAVHNCGLDVVNEYERPELAATWRKEADDSITITGGGRGFGVHDDGGDECILIGRVVRGPAHVAARIRDIDSAEPEAAAGVIARLSSDAHAPFCAAVITSDMHLRVCARTEPGDVAWTQEIDGVYAQPYVRLHCASGLCSISVSEDGTHYRSVTSVQLAPSSADEQTAHAPSDALLGVCALATSREQEWAHTLLRMSIEDLQLVRADGTELLYDGQMPFSYDIGDAPGYIQGRGRSRRAEHLIKRTYINRKGEQAERNSITFNLFLKTKVVGVLGSSFIKTGGHYREIYDDYKHRVESHPRYGLASDDPAATKLHRHNMSVRYACKMFMLDLWREWRALEGLPVYGSYAEEKLGLVHGRERWTEAQPVERIAEAAE